MPSQIRSFSYLPVEDKSCAHGEIFNSASLSERAVDRHNVGSDKTLQNKLTAMQIGNCIHQPSENMGERDKLLHAGWAWSIQSGLCEITFCTATAAPVGACVWLIT